MCIMYYLLAIYEKGKKQKKRELLDMTINERMESPHVKVSKKRKLRVKK